MSTRGEPRPAIGNMPFPGHRTVATVWAQRDAARGRAARKEREAKKYGFDPASLRKEAKG